MSQRHSSLAWTFWSVAVAHDTRVKTFYLSRGPRAGNPAQDYVPGRTLQVGQQHFPKLNCETRLCWCRPGDGALPSRYGPMGTQVGTPAWIPDSVEEDAGVAKIWFVLIKGSRSKRAPERTHVEMDTAGFNSAQPVHRSRASTYSGHSVASLAPPGMHTHTNTSTSTQGQTVDCAALQLQDGSCSLYKHEACSALCTLEQGWFHSPVCLSVWCLTKPDVHGAFGSQPSNLPSRL